MTQIEVEAGVMPWEEACAKRALWVLEKHYAGYSWGITMAPGVMVVRNHSFSNGNKPWGFGLHLTKISGFEFDHRVMQAGGELLERFNRHARAINHEDEAQRGMSRFFETPQT